MGVPFTFSDTTVNVQTSEFHLLIQPEKCQFTPFPGVENGQALISDRVGKLVRELPHTPYQAIGMNFVWVVTPEKLPLPDFTRRLFFSQEQAIDKHFDLPDAKFGGYFSKDSLGCRLKLNVRPLQFQFVESKAFAEGLEFQFNYYRDIGEEKDAPDIIVKQFEQWDEAFSEAKGIVASAIAGVE